MSQLAQLKARQQAEAMKTGEDPYAACKTPMVSAPLLPNPEPEPAAIAQISHSILAEIKAKQIENGEILEPSEAPSASAADVHGDLAHYQAAMSADLASLAVLKDVVEKAKAKASMLLTYLPFVQAYVDKGDNYPNDIAVRVCIWLFDTLQIEQGLALAFHLIKQGIHVTPPKFDRDLQTFVCDAVYDWANALLKHDESANPYLETLVATLDNEQWSLAPPVQSKMYVMLAKHKKRENDWLTVLALCEKAKQVNPEGAGVKGLMKEAREKLKPVVDPNNQ